MKSPPTATAISTPPFPVTPLPRHGRRRRRPGCLHLSRRRARPAAERQLGQSRPDRRLGCLPGRREQQRLRRLVRCHGRQPKPPPVPTAASSKVLINLAQEFGVLPGAIYVAVGVYQSADGGALVPRSKSPRRPTATATSMPWSTSCCNSSPSPATSTAMAMWTSPITTLAQPLDPPPTFAPTATVTPSSTPPTIRSGEDNYGNNGGRGRQLPPQHPSTIQCSRPPSPNRPTISPLRDSRLCVPRRASAIAMNRGPHPVVIPTLGSHNA